MIDVVLQSQRIDGDIGGKIVGGTEQSAFQTLTGNYVGGEPVGLGASGFLFGATVLDANYIGVFFNNSLLDTNVGSNLVGNITDLTQALATVVHKGGFKARLFQGTRHNVADSRPPFSTGVTWAVGDSIYLNSAGTQWTNAASGDNRSTAQGRVILAPASSTEVLEAQFF